MTVSAKHLHEVAQPIFTVDIFIFHKNNLLMFKRSETKKVFPGWWALPGGHIDEGENPLAAAIREAQEETGIILTPHDVSLRFVATHHHLDRKELYVVYGFTATVDELPAVMTDTEEGIGAWIDKTTLATMDNVFPPVKYYFDHVLGNHPGILYNYSTWERSQLVHVESESIDRNG
jgi:8-oxo-dGTP pyrophosphatase MutT (NUDIX family)